MNRDDIKFTAIQSFVFCDFHVISVECMIDAILRSHRSVIEDSRRSTKKFQECAKLIRANSQAILTLEKAIKTYQTENHQQLQKIFYIDRASNKQQDECDGQQQLVEKDDIDETKHSQTPFERSDLTLWTNCLFWTILFSHTMISLAKNS